MVILVKPDLSRFSRLPSFLAAEVVLRHSFANSVTRKKPTDKFTGVFGVHQFLLAEESRVHPGIFNERGIINLKTP